MAKVKNQNSKINVEELQVEIKNLDENWKRALADYQNLVKRVEAEKKDLMRFVSSTMVAKLLPTLDILEMAAHHTQDAGVKMAVKQFQQVLKEEGLEEINPAPGESFDPSMYECVETISGEDEGVAEVVLKGYKINGYVIRPAKVKVWQKS